MILGSAESYTNEIKKFDTISKEANMTKVAINGL